MEEDAEEEEPETEEEKVANCLPMMTLSLAQTLHCLPPLLDSLLSKAKLRGNRFRRRPLIRRPSVVSAA